MGSDTNLPALPACESNEGTHRVIVVSQWKDKTESANVSLRKFEREIYRTKVEYSKKEVGNTVGNKEDIEI